jgi:DNA-binding CsgD family transcriptional regulator
MCPSQDKDIKKDDSLFDKRPPGILLDEKQWLFLKERYHMTPRELQVAILVCRGFNNDEIASSLKIRHGTVKTHLRNLFRRVRVKSKILLLLRFVSDVNRASISSKPGSASIPISEIGSKIEQISKTYHKK